MKKYIALGGSLSAVLMLLAGCGSGAKAGSLTAVYGIMAVLALLLLVGYCFAVPKKDPWFLLLFASVLIVNCGYLMLALSRNLPEALMANRISYLGSVFLPLSMWIIIAKTCRIRYAKWLPGVLLALSTLVFLVAASPGYLSIYYKEVFFEKIDGVSVLTKVYGPLHGLYLMYLLGYFGSMVSTIIYATLQDKIESTAYAVLLAIAVFVNIIVWAIEQIVDIDFEVLSISYIISECFLLGLRFLMLETQKRQLALQAPLPPQSPAPESADEEQLTLFREGLPRLTPKEQEIYDRYIAGMTTAQIMEQLQIKENTLKFHNKNIYSKLGVSSRKQLLRFAALLQAQDKQA